MCTTFFAVATAQTPQTLPAWGSLGLQMVTAFIGGSIAATVLSHLYASAETRREHYAEAVACLVAWCEYPYTVRRRVNDEPVTLQALTKHGHDLQQRIALAEAWVAAESSRMGKRYSALVGEVKREMAPLLQEAWNCSPISGPTEMVLNGWGREMHQRLFRSISEFRRSTRRRFGWRRLIW